MKIQHLRNGVILISIGLVFLFNNLGYVDWEVWETIVSWWPIFLIAIGWEIVFRNTRLKLLALLSPLAFAFFILGPAWWQWEGRHETELVQKTEWSQAISPETKLIQAELEFKLGRLVLAESPQRSIECNLEYDQIEPIQDFSQAGGVAHFRLEEVGKKFYGMRFNSAGNRFELSRADRKEWEVRIDSLTPLELNITSQVSKNELDFRELKLRKLEACFQVAKAEIKIGEKSDTVTLNLDQDLSKVILWVPAEAAVNLDKDVDLGGLSSSNVNLVNLKEEPEIYNAGHPVIYVNYKGALCKLSIRGY